MPTQTTAGLPLSTSAALLQKQLLNLVKRIFTNHPYTPFERYDHLFHTSRKFSIQLSWKLLLFVFHPQPTHLPRFTKHELLPTGSYPPAPSGSIPWKEQVLLLLTSGRSSQQRGAKPPSCPTLGLQRRQLTEIIAFGTNTHCPRFHFLFCCLFTFSAPSWT